ncbi:MAG: carboxypeptidase-like regulatory domain-containing protein, partial [Phaeodactylibacter sp.]|nr:carboxypeptidase-like regulatory domain-containing protein [Phaeodactylibacter sp.]
EKILILFLECLAKDNKNCEPNNCDDKGKAITATVRPLLIRKRDMDKIQDKVRSLGPSAEQYLDMALSDAMRFNLPELRLRRFNVEATALIHTEDIFNAYQAILAPPFVNSVADALSAAYQAFRPVLMEEFGTDPFTNLRNTWAYLHNGGIVSQQRYIYYQYFYDYLDDIIQAYREFREKGLEAMGLCCPDERLFPRHLMLSRALPGENDGSYRHFFAPSPLFSRFHGTFSMLLLLFRRLVAMVNNLELPPGLGTGPNTMTPIKAIPSKLGPYVLSEKAIPYYYLPNPLYRFWDHQKSRQNKAQHNLGYRANSWNNTDDFVLNPLRYDLEPNNFLRIEGHIGQPFTSVMNVLLSLKNRYRLPIEVVALKTGRASGNIPLPQGLEDCQFQDLEALYDSLKEELLCNLCEAVQYFYNTPTQDGQPTGVQLRPNLPLLVNCAPNYQYRPGTVGELYERNLSLLSTFPYPDLNQNAPNPVAGAYNLLLLILQSGNVPSTFIYHILYIYYIVKLSETLPPNLSQLNFADFENKYEDLMAIVRQINNILQLQTPGNTGPGQLDVDELSDQLDHLLYTCKLDPIRSVHVEYQRRLQEIRDKLLFYRFAQQHPGLQHKAGVPLGGTFCIVYHDAEREEIPPTVEGSFVISGRVVSDGEPIIGASVSVVGASFGATTNINGQFQLYVNQLPVRVGVALAGIRNREWLITTANITHELDISGEIAGPVGQPFPELRPGQVIADFYLPYLCCSDCQPVQFVLPKPPPGFAWRQAGCTTPNNTAPVIITPEGGTAPYQYTTDAGQSWQNLGDGPIDIADGASIRIRDAEGTESGTQQIGLVPFFNIDPGGPVCNEEGTQFTVPIIIVGGKPPYTVIANDTVTTVQEGEEGAVTFPSGTGGEVIVQDSSDPACERRAVIEPHDCPQACLLPCAGLAMDCGYLLWLQPFKNEDTFYMNVDLAVRRFRVSGENANGGSMVNSNFTSEQLRELTRILNPAGDITMPNFHQEWQVRIGAANDFINQVLAEDFGPQAGAVMKWEYVPEGLNGFSVLRIEAYACHTFDIQIIVNYRDRYERPYRRQVRYTSNVGTTTEVSYTGLDGNQLNASSKIPAFNCIRRDRCNPNTPEEPLCTDPVALEMAYDSAFPQLFVSISSPSGLDYPVHWEFELGSPPIGSGLNSNTDLPEPGIYEVKAVAVNPENTCASVARENITTQQ